MANTQVGLVNLIAQSAATLKNGTGGGAPARSETSPYLMDNLRVGDRYTLWKSGLLAAAAFNVDFDLGGTVDLSAFGVLGYEQVAGSHVFVDVFTQTGAYAPAGTWTFFGSIARLALDNVRDDGVTDATVSARSVRFVFIPDIANTIITVGSLFAGEATDLGGIHSPGTGFIPYGNQTETPLPSGAVVVRETGRDGGDWPMTWRSVPVATRDVLRSIRDVRGTLPVIDSDGIWREMYVRGRRQAQSMRTATISDIDFELVQCP